MVVEKSAAMRVLISGAGIAGPTLAYFLARTGAQITIFEKAQTILSDGQSIDIDNSAIAIVKKMGIMDEIRRHNTGEIGTRFIDPNGRPFAEMPVRDGKSGSATSEFEILRGDFAKVLYEATKDHPNITYKFGTTIEKVITNDETSVKILPSGSEKEEEYDILVAADGQWSKVRRQCFNPESIKVVDKGMYAVYWTIPRIPSDTTWWEVYVSLRSRLITLRPDQYGTTRAMFTFMPPPDITTNTSTSYEKDQKRRQEDHTIRKSEWQRAIRSDKSVQKSLLKQHFSDAGWQASRLLDSLDTSQDFYFQPCQQIRMSSWHTSRVICLGDAAYAPTPLSGNGTTLAIMGGYLLAGELSKLHKNNDNRNEMPTRAFESYDKLFRPFVDEVQDIPSFVPGIMHPEKAWKRWFLHRFLWGISNVVKIRWLVESVNSEDKFFPLPRYECFDG